MKPKELFAKKEHFGIPLSPLSFVYKDSLFTFSFRPIWGIYGYLTSGKNNTAYRPWRGLSFNLSYNWAEHGSETDTKTLQKIVWTSTAVKMEVVYEIINNTYVSLAYEHSAITEDPKFPLLSLVIFMGDHNIVSGGY